MRRSNFTKVALVALLALAGAGLMGCASSLEGASGQSRLGESLSPAMGGLPAGTPERPATSGAYPAVHDMPPPRADATLSEEQQNKLQEDLAALRSRQAKDAGTEKKPVVSRSANKPAAQKTDNAQE